MQYLSQLHSFNLISCICCLRCGFLYNGETRHRLGKCFVEHLCSVHNDHLEPPSPSRTDLHVLGILHSYKVAGIGIIANWNSTLNSTWLAHSSMVWTLNFPVSCISLPLCSFPTTTSPSKGPLNFFGFSTHHTLDLCHILRINSLTGYCRKMHSL